MRRDAETVDLDVALAQVSWVQRPIPLVWLWRHLPLLGGLVPASARGVFDV
jgi:hypothetical protein